MPQLDAVGYCETISATRFYAGQRARRGGFWLEYTESDAEALCDELGIPRRSVMWEYRTQEGRAEVWQQLGSGNFERVL